MATWTYTLDTDKGVTLSPDRDRVALYPQLFVDGVEWKGVEISVDKAAVDAAATDAEIHALIEPQLAHLVHAEGLAIDTLRKKLATAFAAPVTISQKGIDDAAAAVAAEVVDGP